MCHYGCRLVEVVEVLHFELSLPIQLNFAPYLVCPLSGCHQHCLCCTHTDRQNRQSPPLAGRTRFFPNGQPRTLIIHNCPLFDSSNHASGEEAERSPNKQRVKSGHCPRRRSQHWPMSMTGLDRTGSTPLPAWRAC